MNDDLLNVIKLYFIKKDELKQNLMNANKENLVEIIYQILNLYANDKNSSTLREMITVLIAGYEHNLKKIGFNGHKGEIKCEAKPKNVDTTSNRKHDGSGNFTDFTYDRLERYKTENINIIVSGFINGNLIFVYEFPYSHESFYNRLKQQLDNKFHGNIPSGVFLRSANFSYLNYQDCKELKIHYLNKELLEKHREFFRKGFYEFLLFKGGENE